MPRYSSQELRVEDRTRLTYNFSTQWLSWSLETTTKWKTSTSTREHRSRNILYVEAVATIIFGTIGAILSIATLVLTARSIARRGRKTKDNCSVTYELEAAEMGLSHSTKLSSSPFTGDINQALDTTGVQK